MLQENKRIKNAKYVSHFESIFACPICRSGMKVWEFTSLVCSNHHTFDFAKQGYINLTTQSGKTNYDMELFEARRKLISARFFDQLTDAIASIILNYAAQTKKPISILDAGCGEGSHLANICEIIRSEYHKNVTGVGIDLSKDGVKAASKNYMNHIWAVSDLANAPFKSKQFDIILNILSPSNDAEFNRLLKTDGLVIKVIPQSDYLKELREYLFHKRGKQNDSNEKTVERFHKNFQFVGRSRLSYTINLNQPSIEWLVRMTPLTWTAQKERINSFLNKSSTQLTVDLDVLVGKKGIKKVKQK